MTTEQDQNFGPKMAALSPLQRAWVYALVSQGGNPTDAARTAGYGATSETQKQRDVACAVAGNANARNPKVQDAIREEAGHRLYSGALIGAEVLIQIASDPTHKDRLKAATKLLEHNGYQIIAQQEINVTHNTPTEAETIARVKTAAAQLGIDARTLLGKHGIVVDADFQVVDTGAKALTAPAELSSEGLEDLL